jgi:hypothetical protein
MLSVLTQIIQLCIRLMKPVAELCLLSFNPFILETDFPFLNYKSKQSFHYSYTGSNTTIYEIAFTDITEEWLNSDNEEINSLVSDKRIESVLEYFVNKAELLYSKNTIEVSSDSLTLLWLFALF